MKLKVYTVYDSKVGAYLQPFFMQSRGQAIRAFSDSVNDTSTQFYKHAEDFTLFEIGEYDDEKGAFSQEGAHVSLGVAQEFKSVERLGNVASIQ